jgi:hypothetical protein
MKKVNLLFLLVFKVALKIAKITLKIVNVINSKNYFKRELYFLAIFKVSIENVSIFFFKYF